jgi:hypothetical protein
MKIQRVRHPAPGESSCVIRRGIDKTYNPRIDSSLPVDVESFWETNSPRLSLFDTIP